MWNTAHRNHIRVAGTHPIDREIDARVNDGRGRNDRVWFEAVHGVEGVTEIPRDAGLCTLAIRDSRTDVVRDTAERDRATVADYAAVLQRALLPLALAAIPGDVEGHGAPPPQ